MIPSDDPMTGGVRHIDVKGLDSGLPYSTATGYGDLVFLSGVVSHADSAPFGDQVREVIDLAEHALGACGATLGTLLRAGCYLVDAADFDEFNDIWRCRVPAPRPARTTIVTAFAGPGLRFELDAVAVRAVQGREPGAGG